MTLNLEDFAEKYRVKIRRDECGEAVIFGRRWKAQPISQFSAHRQTGEFHYGHHIGDHGNGFFSLTLMFDSPARWTFAEKKLRTAGFTIKQSGISKGVPPKHDRFGEGIALFDPANEAQARLALGLAGVRIRRNLTPEQREAMAERLRLRIAKTPPKAA